MVYKDNIPRKKDDVSVSQADLLENFSELNTQFGVNHVAFDSGNGDEGKHKFVTFVEQASDPETQSDEYLIYAKNDNGEPELYARPQENGTAFQITKNGGLFYGARPVAAVNFEPDGTIISGFNVASVTPSGSSRFLITFTNQIEDEDGTPTADYFWDIQGMRSDSGIVIGRPQNNSNYATNVKPTSFAIVFVNSNNAEITTLVRGSVIIWSQP